MFQKRAVAEYSQRSTMDSINSFRFIASRWGSEGLSGTE